MTICWEAELICWTAGVAVCGGAEVVIWTAGVAVCCGAEVVRTAGVAVCCGAAVVCWSAGVAVCCGADVVWKAGVAVCCGAEVVWATGVAVCCGAGDILWTAGVAVCCEAEVICLRLEEIEHFYCTVRRTSLVGSSPILVSLLCGLTLCSCFCAWVSWDGPTPFVFVFPLGLTPYFSLARLLWVGPWIQLSF